VSNKPSGFEVIDTRQMLSVPSPVFLGQSNGRDLVALPAGLSQVRMKTTYTTTDA